MDLFSTKNKKNLNLGDKEMNEDVLIIESKPTKIKYKGIVWVPEVKKIKNIGKNHVGNKKKPYIVKWVEKKLVGDIFTKDEFYQEHPKIKKEKSRRRRVDEEMQNMILNRCITVHDNIPGKYRVLK